MARATQQLSTPNGSIYDYNGQFWAPEAYNKQSQVPQIVREYYANLASIEPVALAGNEFRGDSDVVPAIGGGPVVQINPAGSPELFNPPPPNEAFSPLDVFRQLLSNPPPPNEQFIPVDTFRGAADYGIPSLSPPPFSWDYSQNFDPTVPANIAPRVGTWPSFNKPPPNEAGPAPADVFRGPADYASQALATNFSDYTPFIDFSSLDQGQPSFNTAPPNEAGPAPVDVFRSPADYASVPSPATSDYQSATQQYGTFGIDWGYDSNGDPVSYNPAPPNEAGPTPVDVFRDASAFADQSPAEVGSGGPASTSPRNVIYITPAGMVYNPATGMFHNPNFDPSAAISGGTLGPQGSVYGYDPITGKPIYNATGYQSPAARANAGESFALKGGSQWGWNRPATGPGSYQGLGSYETFPGSGVYVTRGTAMDISGGGGQGVYRTSVGGAPEPSFDPSIKNEIDYGAINRAAMSPGPNVWGPYGPLFNPNTNQRLGKSNFVGGAGQYSNPFSSSQFTLSRPAQTLAAPPAIGSMLDSLGEFAPALTLAGSAPEVGIGG